MSMETLEEALRLMEQSRELTRELGLDGEALVEFEGPQPAERVKAAERELGLTFPPTYREFLSRLGCGHFGEDEFYGLFDDALNGYPNVVWLTLGKRRDAGMPSHLIWIHSELVGTPHVIDTLDDCVVCTWRTGAELEWVAEDFGDFLLERVELQLRSARNALHTFEEAVELIEQNRALARLDEPQPEERIATAERALGLTFPPTYRAFLKRFGCGTFGSDEFYGVWEQMEPNVPNVVWLTLRARELYGLPNHLIRVHEEGEGTSYVINTMDDDAICTWRTGEDPEWYNGSFGHFLFERVELQLELAAEDDDDEDGDE